MSLLGTTTTQQSWEAAINDLACEPFVLLAYADWLEEAGDGTARAWRWFVETKSEPHKPYDAWIWYAVRHVPLDVWQASDVRLWKARRNVTDEESSLPLNGTTRSPGNVWANHPTRFAAYAAAAKALVTQYKGEIPKP